MTADTWAQLGLLLVGVVLFATWAYRNVWRGPTVARAVVVEKTWEEAAMRLGERIRCTANDESWKRVHEGDEVKVWIQDRSHVVGVYVLNRRPK